MNRPEGKFSGINLLSALQLTAIVETPPDSVARQYLSFLASPAKQFGKYLKKYGLFRLFKRYLLEIKRSP